MGIQIIMIYTQKKKNLRGHGKGRKSPLLNANTVVIATDIQNSSTAVKRVLMKYCAAMLDFAITKIIHVR